MGQNGRKDNVGIWRKADTQSSVPRVHYPEECLKAKVVGNTLLCRFGYDYNCFRTIISVNQLSLYGAVAVTCEEYETYPDRTGRPVVGGQWSSLFVPNVIKTEMLLDCDDRARKDLLLKKMENELRVITTRQIE